MRKAEKYSCIMSAVLLFCCADTYTWNNRKEPRGYFNGILNNYALEDSVKTFFKSGGGALSSRSFTLTSNVTDIPKTLYIVNVSGGMLKVDGAAVTSGSEVPLNRSKFSVTCVFEPEIGATTTYRMLFRIKDLGGWTGSATVVTLRAFKNIPPTAAFTATKGENGKYTFDASASYDGDKRFGGTIATYDYVITGTKPKKFSTRQSRFENYGFPRLGNYTVSLRVTDSDGDQSNAVTKVIAVE